MSHDYKAVKENHTASGVGSTGESSFWFVVREIRLTESAGAGRGDSRLSAFKNEERRGEAECR